MKQRVFYFLLALAVSACLLAACNRRQPNADTAAGGAASPTAMPANGAPSASSATQPAGQAATPAAPASLPANARSTASKAGWWVRINTSLTTAPTITFQIGTSKLQREEWRVWRAGEPAEFDVPASYAQAAQLYLRGNVSPVGKLADLCLMHKNRGVEHMDFDDDSSETKRPTQVDYKCR